MKQLLLHSYQNMKSMLCNPDIITRTKYLSTSSADLSVKANMKLFHCFQIGSVSADIHISEPMFLFHMPHRFHDLEVIPEWNSFSLSHAITFSATLNFKWVEQQEGKEAGIGEPQLPSSSDTAPKQSQYRRTPINEFLTTYLTLHAKKSCVYHVVAHRICTQT